MSTRARVTFGVLFGFSGKEQGDVWRWVRDTRTWELVHDRDAGAEIPTPRSVFGACQLTGPAGELLPQVFLFGGERDPSALGHAGAGEFHNDAYVLDLESASWTRVEGGTAPPARGWVPAVAGPAGSLYVFGGLNNENARLGDLWRWGPVAS